MKSDKPNKNDFSIIFEKLEESKEEQKVHIGLTELAYSEIHESIQMLQDIQQSIDTNSYTYFTRT